MQVLVMTYMENVATLGVGSTDIFISQATTCFWMLVLILHDGIHPLEMHLV